MRQVRNTLEANYSTFTFDSIMMRHEKVWSYLADCHSEDEINQDSEEITMENFIFIGSNVMYKNSNTKESHSALCYQAEKSNDDMTKCSCLLSEIDLQRHMGTENRNITNIIDVKKDCSVFDNIQDASIVSYHIGHPNVASKSTDFIEEEDSIQTFNTNIFSDMCQKSWNNLSNQSNCRKETVDSEIPRKRSKQRRKVIAIGRGRGRARSQLRRSGVSQTRHRRKHRNHEFAIKNDHVDQEFSNSDDYDVNVVPLIQATNSVTSDSSSISTIISMKQTQRQKKKISSDMLEKLDSSIDSEDSFCIVFTSKPEEDLDETDNTYQKKSLSQNKETLKNSIVFEDNICIAYAPELNENENDQNDEYDKSETQKKKVRFDPTPVVHIMVKWNYAYRAARKGPWEEMARDNERFKGRINSIGAVLNPILTSKHRSEIWQERFAS
ncbi:uncharacterized protein LOC109861729 [Pseudomyrmex gracilis]|uniref:uncharacterized protein LOC109861729 n=1 Tax=Pseudomyrmex gracilis TaxID=219809 RepID=UPI00099515D0|nr:uncharacterized protein LOC109861729 [Pseudomyrmex gracilis]